MPNFTRYKRGTHITVNIKIIWALSVSKNQWKDSGLNTGSNKGNVTTPWSFLTRTQPDIDFSHLYYTSYTSRWLQLLWEAQFLRTAALKGDKSHHWSPLLLLLTTDFRDTFHLFARQSRSWDDQAKFKQINSNVILKQLIIDRDLVTLPTFMVTGCLLL